MSSNTSKHFQTIKLIIRCQFDLISFDHYFILQIHTIRWLYFSWRYFCWNMSAVIVCLGYFVLNNNLFIILMTYDIKILKCLLFNVLDVQKFKRFNYISLNRPFFDFPFQNYIKCCWSGIRLILKQLISQFSTKLRWAKCKRSYLKQKTRRERLKSELYVRLKKRKTFLELEVLSWWKM